MRPGLGNQRGQNVVELIVAMGVAAAVLIGLTGVVLAASRAFTAWAAPDQRAAGLAGLAPLVLSIQADSHRYVPCQLPGGPWLKFCDPACPTSTIPPITYNNIGVLNSGLWTGTVTRSAGAQPATSAPVVVTGLISRSAAGPIYTVSSADIGGIESGSITISADVPASDRTAFSDGQPSPSPVTEVVYFRDPFFVSPTPGPPC